MKYRTWGRTGLQCSQISLGTMAFGRWIDEALSTRIIDVALDAGINVVDTADVYGRGMDTGNPDQTGESESILGRALKGRRSEVILSTKVKAPVGRGVNDAGLSRYHIYRAINNSLKRLQTDYIDIYHVHGFDSAVPLEETLRALDDLVRAGKVRYLACSNFAAWQIAKAHGLSIAHGWSRFEGVQPEYSLITRGIERELVPFVQSEKVGMLTYSPLGRGMLTGKYKQNIAPPADSRLAAGERRLELLLENQAAYQLVDALQPIAERRGWTLAQLALVWVWSHSYVTSTILGLSRPEQLSEFLPLLDEELTIEEGTELDTLARELHILVD